MGDFLFTSALTGGNETLTLAIMASSAAAKATMNAKERNLSDSQAFALGAVAGILELVSGQSRTAELFEHLDSRNAMIHFLKQGLPEGTDHALNGLLERIADALLVKDKSEWQRLLERYRQQGLSEKEALWHLVVDPPGQTGMDFLSGYAAGTLTSEVEKPPHAGFDLEGVKP